MTDHAKALYDYRWDQINRALWIALRQNATEKARANHALLCRLEAGKAPVAAQTEIGGQ